MTIAHIKRAIAGDTRAFAAVMKAQADLARVLGVQGTTPEEMFKAKEDERARQAKADELVRGFTRVLDGLTSMKKSGLVEMVGGEWTFTKPAGRFSAFRQRRRRGTELTPEELAAITAWEAYEQHLDGESPPH